MKFFKSRLLTIALILAIAITGTVSGLVPYRNAEATTNGDVVINEVAWMGTTYSSYDEWMELYNNTSTSIDLTGWTLRATDGTPNITLSGSIPAGGYFLLERTDDTSVPGINANQIYTGALNDTGEVLELRDAAGNLIDKVGAGAWYAGNNTSKSTMERINPLASGTDPANWNTSTITYNGGNGTPKALNSSSGGGGGGGSGNLEIHHLDIGQGDSTLVISPTGKTLLIDAGETNWNSSANAQKIASYIQNVTGAKHLDYVLVTHFHLDHIGYVNYGGLWNLVNQQGFTVGKTILRDYKNYLGTTSGTFDNWAAYLKKATAKSLLNPVTAVEGTGQIDLGGGVIVNTKVTDGNGAIKVGDFSNDATPPSENDYCTGVKIKYGLFDEWVGGDLSGEYFTSPYGYKYHDIEVSAAKDIGDVDVYRVNHHGSSHSSNAAFVGQLDPEVSIISVGDGNTYGHPAQPVMDRVLATSNVYLTERGDTSTNIGNAVVSGNTVVITNGTSYTVNGTSYTATDPSRIDADGDGYFAGVDPNDSNSSIIPQPNGGYDPVYQP